MPIYINKNGQQSGPYEDHIVIDQLRSGVLSPNDMGIRHGDPSWQRLGDMFPDSPPQPRATPSIPIPPPSASTAAIASDAPAAKKGGCLKAGLIGTGLLLLVFGIIAAAGSRFIPSVSCDLAESDKEKIDRLNRDIAKAKSDFKYDRIGPLQIELDAEMAGYEVSRKHCENDQFTFNIILGAGVVAAIVGLLMAVVGLFVGRRS